MSLIPSIQNLPAQDLEMTLTQQTQSLQKFQLLWRLP